MDQKQEATEEAQIMNMVEEATKDLSVEERAEFIATVIDTLETTLDAIMRQGC